MEDVEVKNIVSEVLEISESIAEKSKELDTLYIGLGKAYFEICKDNPDESLSEIAEEIKSTKNSISELEKKLEKLISDTVVKPCVSETENVQDTIIEEKAEKVIEDVTQSKASESKQVEITEDKKICKKCGTAAPMEMLFCVECGNKFENEDNVAQPEKTHNPSNDEKICPKCGKHSVPQMRFCTDCGTKLDEVKIQEPNKCPRCKTELADDMIFCVECGYKVVKEQKNEAVNPYAQPMKKICPVCKSVQSSNMKFCTECGTSL
ncbi:MAG: zinc ribbon domain-containing protein [Ruminococcus sp.]|nr:zinc ribbon domain-containing protein [Ruminococcus sp.]